MERRSFLRGAACALAGITLNRCAAQSAMPQNGDHSTPSLTPLLAALSTPILFHGDRTTAYRDPAVVYDKGDSYLYLSYVKTFSDGIPYNRVAWTKSEDLKHWTDLRMITPKDKSLEFSSPGDVVRYGDQWVLCMQTYPRPHGEAYGNQDSRIWTANSRDLRHWGKPELLRVKGPGVARADMGRMIDPFLLRDKDDPKKWWCLYKQNGISLSFSYDLQDWSFVGSVPAGENPCVIVDKDEYVLFHSPRNGIGIKRSSDLMHWRDVGLVTLGQKDWEWAQGRITAGFVVDLRTEPRVGKALMFFHGSQYPENDPRGGFNNYASIGIAWSDDLENWAWPGVSLGSIATP